MKWTAGIPLLFTGLVGITWLMDFVRENDWPGSLFSIGLLLSTLVVVSYWEGLQERGAPKPLETPPKTRGLVISLGLLKPSDRDALERGISLLRSLNRPSDGLHEWLRAAINLKARGRTAPDDLAAALNVADPSLKAATVGLLGSLLGTPLYTPLAAVAHHYSRLEWTWVLLTEKARTDSWETFKDLVGLFFAGQRLEPVDIKDPNDVAKVSAEVNRVYEKAQEYGIPEDEVTSDITGGTASMSVGIVLACIRSRRRVQYLRQDTFMLQSIDVTVRTIPGLLDELFEQLELVPR